MIKYCNAPFASVALISNSDTKSSVLNTLQSEFLKMKVLSKDFASKSEFETYVSRREYGKDGKNTFCLGI